MHLKDSITIDASPEAVWPFLADPVMQSLWNPKVVAIDRTTEGPVRMGERFEMIYRMSGRDRQSQVTVIECDPPRCVVFEHRMTDDAVQRMTRESYRLNPKGDTVRVVQAVDLGGLGINRLVQCLIWFIHRFGRSVGEPYLATLKRRVETGE